jgi:arsenate reductase-like glutaredoxin family protein
MRLYTQAGCAESAQVRAWLAEHGIAFTEQDASRDPAAAEALAATGTFATPLLVVGKNTVLGFRPRALAALLYDQDHPGAIAASAVRP